MTQPGFDSIKVGDEIPILNSEPITRHTLALYCGASGDHHPIHVEMDYAREAGLDDVIAHGMLSMAYVGRLLTNWVSQSSIRELRGRFTAMTLVGDSVSCYGKVTNKFSESGEKRIRLELTAEPPREQTIIGEAVVALD